MTALDFYGPLPNSKVATVTQARGFFRGLGASGIYPANYGLYATDFVCSDGGGLDVSVAAGEALVDGIYATSSSVKAVTLDAADATNDRIDLVVLELDQAAGTVTLEKVTGTPAAAPAAPAVTQEADGTFQLALAEVTVPSGSAVLGTITDVRQFATMLGAGEPTDGDTMVYDSATGLWVPGNASSGWELIEEIGPIGSNATAFDFNPIATGYALLLVEFDLTAVIAPGGFLHVQLNGVTTAVYEWQLAQLYGGAWTPSQGSAATSARVSALPGNTRPARNVAGTLTIPAADRTVEKRAYFDAVSDEDTRELSSFGVIGESGVIDRIYLFTGSGNGFLAGSSARLYGLKGS